MPVTWATADGLASKSSPADNPAAQCHKMCHVLRIIRGYFSQFTELVINPRIGSIFLINPFRD